MRPKLVKSVGVAVLCLAASALTLTAANTASLRVAPTLIEMVAPDSTSAINLHNEASRPLNVQVRVFRWRQENGIERLEATSDVVASPPAAQLQPSADYVVRVVRVSKTPVTTEESYRVVVDELPDPSQRRAHTVNLVVRYLIPVFFRNPDAPAPDVSWSLSRSGRGFILSANNTGGSRLRVSDFAVLGEGRKVAGQKGLLGYVLGGATMKWTIAADGRLPSRSATLKANSEIGPFDAAVAVTSP